MSKHPIAGVRRRNKIAGQFSWRLVAMLESPAYRVLSLSAHRVLDRLEVELAHHGGHDNGALPVTYADFENFGIDRHAVAPALREVEALGFVRITEHGRGGNAEFRTPNKFQLTYRPTKDGAGPTDAWKKIQTIEEAQAFARAARTPIKRPPRRKYFPVGEKTIFSGGFPHRKRNFPLGVSPLQGHLRNPQHYLYLGAGMGSLPWYLPLSRPVTGW